MVCELEALLRLSQTRAQPDLARLRIDDASPLDLLIEADRVAEVPVQRSGETSEPHLAAAEVGGQRLGGGVEPVEVVAVLLEEVPGGLVWGGGVAA